MEIPFGAREENATSFVALKTALVERIIQINFADDGRLEIVE
ncbi:MAG TPA: hypothetical protein VM659_11815 [Dongiaceae bacterium]|nr:hypothetical protein [Dongiaceae bacterium]